jgi:toxin ParE1/3/4
MWRVTFDPAAQAELNKAIDDYENEEEGLGRRFLNEVIALKERIERRPGLFPVVLGLPPRDPPIQRGRLKVFPFVLVFICKDDEIRILAVAHGKRLPNYWMDRARSR